MFVFRKKNVALLKTAFVSYKSLYCHLVFNMPEFERETSRINLWLN